MRTNRHDTNRSDLEALLDRTENLELDFKRDARGLRGEDLVAFANTRTGGVILVGVAEESGADGRQIARVVGCRTGDDEKLQIVNKAQECLPSIHVQVVEEEYQGKTFFRVEVPPSSVRPHCTSSGTYKARADGRNRALRPDEISAILLERESESFRSRFSEATATLARTLDRIVSEIQGIEANLEADLQRISGSAENASSEASDAAWTLRSLEDSVTSLERSDASSQRSLAQVHKRLAHLLQAGGIIDPVADGEKKALKEEICDFLRKHPNTASHWATATAVEITSNHAAKLTSEQVIEAAAEALNEFQKEQVNHPTCEAQKPKKQPAPTKTRVSRRKPGK